MQQHRENTVSERVRSKRSRELEKLFKNTLALKPGTAQSLLPGLINAAREHLGLEIGFISEFKANRRYFRFIQQPFETPLLRVNSSDPLESSFCQRVVDGRLPRLMKNAMEEPEARSLLKDLGLEVGAHISVPITLADGTLYGTFCCFSSKPDLTLTERDLAFFSVLANLVASVLDQDIATSRVFRDKTRRIEEVMQSDALTSVWQPIVNVAEGRIVGVEALARFPIEPRRPPNIWFEEAAEVGLTPVLEKQALIKGLEILNHLAPDLYVTCNLSAEALLNAEVREPLDQVDLSRVVLEITEHDIVSDYEDLARVLVELRQRGARVAVDDFGAGYASFRHILYLRPDLIKLDISLVRNIDQEDTKRAVVESLIGFARASGQRLIAEGVETDSELQTLRSLGIRTIQGYLLHRPLPRHDLLRLFATDPVEQDQDWQTVYVG
jgi:EAL domain-containing protein (putative c-di-GMP-specific phosphodiesterase class I)